MGHDATKVLLGASGSSDKAGSEVYASDPATYLAGLAVRLASTGLLVLAKASGSWAGISMGKSLSDHKKTCVLRAGLLVPMLLANKRARSTITISSYANLVSGTDDSVTIAGQLFTAQVGAVTPGGATFQAATSNDATATSLAAQINAHAVVGLLVRATVASAVVTVSAISEVAATGNAITIVYTDNDSNVGITLGNASGGHLNSGSDDPDDIDYVTLGAKVYIDDVSGKACANTTGTTISDAVYASAVLTGINEDASEVPAALVDMVGGL